MQIEGLDELNNRILTAIENNARLSYSEIGQIVGLSRVAVKTRMDQMEKSGIIKEYRTVADPGNVPGSIRFYLDIDADPAYIDDVLNRISSDKMIRQVYMASGNCRIHAVGLAPNQATLQVYARNLYHNQKGVLRMSYASILCTLKDLDGGIEYEKRVRAEEEPGTAADAAAGGRQDIR